MMRIALLLAAIGATSPAMAAPTYLVCTFQNEDKTQTLLDVTADEANGQVTTLVENTGHMEKRPAVFSPTAVKWAGTGSLGLAYSLSRTDLTLERVLTIGDKKFPDHATCKIQTAVKRAF